MNILDPFTPTPNLHFKNFTLSSEICLSRSREYLHSPAIINLSQLKFFKSHKSFVWFFLSSTDATEIICTPWHSIFPKKLTLLLLWRPSVRAHFINNFIFELSLKLLIFDARSIFLMGLSVRLSVCHTFLQICKVHTCEVIMYLY